MFIELAVRLKDLEIKRVLVPEQEDIERHPDRISLPTDPDGFQDARVSQLAAHQFVFHHTWQLNTVDKYTCEHTNTKPSSNDQCEYRIRINLPSCYLA